MSQPVFAESDATARIVTGLERIGHLMEQLLKMQAMEHGLSPLQVNILIHIHFREKACTLNQLAVAFDLSKATLSVALRSMEQKKLIHRKTMPGDKRSRLIGLTEWGRRLAHVAGFYPEPLRRIVAPMALTDKQRLLHYIEGIVHRLEAAEDMSDTAG
ncbi:MarR family winged helix-turn-helix transcriptional regulator [Taibaiella koreensis]|uniref:MarR family winged helix-turn-helix transcriptional regulator n=1 Tax=Taibaiella koreensis TaxID=1268548 RepID=UPI0013C30A2B|nr:MarR family transcriptional regulator [Taibaiella koreensis]